MVEFHYPMVIELDFPDWLQNELNRRGWDQAGLASRSGISSAQVSRLITGIRNPGTDTCTAIARALNLPPEVVFRKAGLLPTESEYTSEEKEAVHILRELSPERRQYILTTMRALASGTPAPARKTSTS